MRTPVTPDVYLELLGGADDGWPEHSTSHVKPNTLGDADALELGSRQPILPGPVDQDQLRYLPACRTSTTDRT